MTIIDTIDTAFANLDNARTYLREQLENGVEIVACAFSEGGEYFPPTAINAVRPPKIIFLSNRVVLDFVIAGPWEVNRDFWKREWPKQGFYVALNDAARKLNVRFTPDEDGHYYYDGAEFVRCNPDNDEEFLAIRITNSPMFRVLGSPSMDQVA